MVENKATKYINLSLPKTGTTSFGKLMASHGKNVCDGAWRDYKTNFLWLAGVSGAYELIDQAIEPFDVMSDGPFGGTAYYIHAAEHFPEAKYLLVIRDDDDWWTSLDTMIDKIVGEENRSLGLQEKIDLVYKMGRFGFAIWAAQFCKNNFSKDGFIQAKRSYEEHVSQHFAGQNNFKRLSFPAFLNNEASEFLGTTKSLPHENKSNR